MRIGAIVNRVDPFLIQQLAGNPNAGNSDEKYSGRKDVLSAEVAKNLGASVCRHAVSWSSEILVAADIVASVNPELLNQATEFGRGFDQLLRGFLSVSGAACGALGGFCHASDVAGNLAAAVRRFAHVA
jgi:hypothetical protein